eukprot:393807-Amphidinium_carterae.1
MRSNHPSVGATLRLLVTFFWKSTSDIHLQKADQGKNTAPKARQWRRSISYTASCFSMWATSRLAKPLLLHTPAVGQTVRYKSSLTADRLVQPAKPPSTRRSVSKEAKAANAMHKRKSSSGNQRRNS